MPNSIRGKMVVGGFSFQVMGALVGAGVGIIILLMYPSLDAWRWILCFGVVPAILIILFRLSLSESSRWLIERGRTEEVSNIFSELTKKEIILPDKEKSNNTVSFWTDPPVKKIFL